MRREWIEITRLEFHTWDAAASPSMRREWIEIIRCKMWFSPLNVSLHAEGVD